MKSKTKTHKSRLAPKRSHIDSLESQSVSPDVVDFEKIILEQNFVIDKKTEVIKSQQKRIAILEENLRLNRANQFGRSSEKNSDQGEFFDEVETLAEETEDDQLSETTPSKKKSNAGRKGLSKNIPREQVYIDLTDEEKEGAIDVFYTTVKEELDITPAKVRVLEYLQQKAVFADTNEDGTTKRTIKAATMPKHPLNKAIGSISLLAYIIIAKFCDGLPLYRQENILSRYGGTITRTTMANWMIRLSLQLQPLINLMREHQLEYDYIQGDETTIAVLKEEGRSPTSKKYMWVTLGGPPDKPAILFEYDPSRGKEVPQRLFEGYTGYLQVDGYPGYDAVCLAQGITQLGCMDHLRRYYVNAQKAQPKKNKSGNVSKADVAIGKLRRLYKIEKEIKDLSVEERYRQRQKLSVPLLQDFKTWVDKNIGKVEKGSLTHKALVYSRNQWPKIIRYCDDGRLHMSNILAENAIRPFVIGRKNWLFADTSNGAKASATLYSLIESAKANGLEPYKYFCTVLKQIPYAENVEDFEKLLPWNIER